MRINRVSGCISVALFLSSVLMLTACSQSTDLTDDELKAASEITGSIIAESDAEDITAAVMTGDRQEKFPAVKKVHKTAGNSYIFIAEPVAYNGPVTILTVIDGNRNETIGMRILRHEETDHYVRDMESPWFTNRFSGKTVLDYLIPVRLESHGDNEVIMITGATVTTEGIVNGVNASMGAYREFVLGQPAEAVDLMVEHND